MRIEVKVLTGPSAGRRDYVELPTGATGEQLLEAMGMEDVQSVLIIVSGRRRKRDDEIYEGDAVDLLTPVGGG